jgi:hypothetical protein
MNFNRILLVVAVAFTLSMGLAIVAGAGPIRLFLEDGTVIGGQTVDPGNPEFTGEPGASLDGTLSYRCENETLDNAAVEGVLTWETDHEQSYAPLGAYAPGVNHETFSFTRLQLPPAGGTYYMVLGAYNESHDGYVASMTSPSCIAAVWGDGNDLADQNATTLAGALTNGWASLPMWLCDHMTNTSVGATYITVHVLDHAVGACCIGQSPEIQCRITSETACTDQGGTYLGETTVCDPFPCLVPTSETTWGQVKSLYR